MNLQTLEEWIKNAPVNLFPTRPQGVKEGRRASDYMSGSSPIKYEVVNPSGDWRPYLVRGEKQWYPSFDTFNCTGYANNNSAEIQIKFRTGVELNFSDRALSVLAECAPTGNYLYKPADVGRNIGRILEQDWPDDDGPPQTWKEYNKLLPANVKAKAIRFKEEYEWVQTSKASIEYHLKQAPLLAVIDAGGGQLHNVVIVFSDNKGLWYFDSYDPWLKLTTQLPSSILKLIVKPVTNAKLVNNKGEWGFLLPNTSETSLIDDALNFGYLLPTKNDGKEVDWPNVKADITIV